MSDTLTRVLDRVRAAHPDSVQRLCDFLRIPSISADPAYKAQTAQAGTWCVEQLRSAGLNAQLMPTAGHPMVVATHEGPPGWDGPRILYYGHYDVQPPDPLALWTSPPFEPTIVDGPKGKRVVARGAVDDKGQVMTFIEAFRAWRDVHGTLPCPVTVLLEGEEESGSASLEPFLKAHSKMLAADVCVVSDTGMWDIDTPAVTTMLRGLVYVEITVHGPSRDLHSGMYGGAVPNPCNVLASILAQLHDANRVVQIPGFYDDVREVSAPVKAQWASLQFPEGEFLGDIGLKSGFGEKGRTTLERTWSRPTCDVNGMWGGYTGAGAKTVIASHASAKLSCRLVADQDPGKVLAGIRAFVEARLPAGCRYEIAEFGAAPAFSVRDDNPFLSATQRALKGVFGRDAALIGSGGSIPAVGAIRTHTGADALLVGFGLDDDCVHSPNEKFELRCLLNGTLSHAAMLHEFGLMRR
jgi:acetylornithine deacetylase/succinyl-diaminopimelate desuccinylase-like protein